MKATTFVLCISLFWIEAAQIKSRKLGKNNVQFQNMYNITKTKITGGRIIGGEEANAGQFPFAAAIYKSTADGRFFCGGAVAQPQWIITAGQCVDG